MVSWLAIEPDEGFADGFTPGAGALGRREGLNTKNGSHGELLLTRRVVVISVPDLRAGRQELPRFQSTLNSSVFYDYCLILLTQLESLYGA
jgi:hypothetical protein